MKGNTASVWLHAQYIIMQGLIVLKSRTHYRRTSPSKPRTFEATATTKDFTLKGKTKDTVYAP